MHLKYCLNHVCFRLKNIFNGLIVELEVVSAAEIAPETIYTSLRESMSNPISSEYLLDAAPIIVDGILGNSKLFVNTLFSFHVDYNT